MELSNMLIEKPVMLFGSFSPTPAWAHGHLNAASFVGTGEILPLKCFLFPAEQHVTSVPNAS
ncbi:MAG: hypothetical protein NTW56_19920 [Alphaproteobacteria bacterium]|nr:hypothetical protein [Alphaproteobacteria bacterium]